MAGTKYSISCVILRLLECRQVSFWLFLEWEDERAAPLINSSISLDGCKKACASDPTPAKCCDKVYIPQIKFANLAAVNRVSSLNPMKVSPQLGFPLYQIKQYSGKFSERIVFFLGCPRGVQHCAPG